MDGDLVQYRIPRDILNEIQVRTSIVEVVSRYVTLRKRGRSHTGLCPFHGEKTPSFHVDEAKRLFYCFGCQEGGDVFKFMTLIENQSFMEVVRELAQRSGVSLPERPMSAEEKRDLSEKETMLHLYEVAAGLYERQMLGEHGKAARDYLAKRQLPEEVIKAARVGYAPPGWSNLLEHYRRLGHSLQVAEKAGLLLTGQKSRQYDRFRERVMFPIRDVSGAVIAFGGRILGDGQPKYLNSPETALFNKSEALYGIDVARRSIGKEDHVIVVEGYFDALSLHAIGVSNVVATCGTSLTRGHLRVLKRYTRRVMLMYDGDKAGLKAAERSLPLFLEEDLWPYFVSLPAGQDPDDAIKAEGGEAFIQRIRKALPLFDHIVMRQARESQRSVEAQENALKQLVPLAPLLKRLRPEKADFYISFIAQHFGLREQTIRAEFHQVERAQHREQRGGVDLSLRRPPPVRPSISLPPHEETLLHWVLQDAASIMPAVMEANIVEWLTHPALQRLMQHAITRYQDDGKIDSGEIVSLVEDDALKTKLVELSVKELAIDPEDHEKALTQCLLGIKEKNLDYLVRTIQGEIARLGREGGDPVRLNQLLMQKTELNREKDSLRRRGGSAS